MVGCNWITREELYDLHIVKKLSLSTIGLLKGKSTATPRHWCKIWKIPIRDKWDYPHKYTHKPFIIMWGRKMIRHPNHPFATNHQAYVYEHHKVWTEFHQRPIPTGFVLHHINMDKHDNRLSNLLLCTNTQHTKLHWLIRKGHITIFEAPKWVLTQI